MAERDIEDDTEVEITCVRCEYKWQGKYGERPDKCPECGLVSWDGERKVPIWKYGGMAVETVKHPKMEDGD